MLRPLIPPSSVGLHMRNSHDLPTRAPLRMNFREQAKEPCPDVASSHTDLNWLMPIQHNEKERLPFHQQGWMEKLKA